MERDIPRLVIGSFAGEVEGHKWSIGEGWVSRCYLSLSCIPGPTSRAALRSTQRAPSKKRPWATLDHHDSWAQPRRYFSTQTYVSVPLTASAVTHYWPGDHGVLKLMHQVLRAYGSHPKICPSGRKWGLGAERGGATGGCTSTETLKPFWKCVFYTHVYLLDMPLVDIKFTIEWQLQPM